MKIKPYVEGFKKPDIAEEEKNTVSFGREGFNKISKEYVDDMPKVEKYVLDFLSKIEKVGEKVRVLRDIEGRDAVFVIEPDSVMAYCSHNIEAVEGEGYNETVLNYYKKNAEEISIFFIGVVEINVGVIDISDILDLLS